MMDVVICRAPGVLEVERRPLPARGDDEVLLKVRRVGLCGTDMHIFKGDQPYLSYPRVMGHEFSAEVLVAPVHSGLRTGEQVFVAPYVWCGECPPCRKSKTNCCMRLEVYGVHRDGALTQYLAVPHRLVFRADGVSLDHAAMVEFLAVGAHAVRRGRPAAGESVLVAGAGPIGLAVAAFAGLAGAQVTLVDGRRDRLAAAARMPGVANVIELDGDLDVRLRDLTDGLNFDVVFDATGNPEAMMRGFGFVGHGGRYVLVSVVSADISFADPEFHRREMTLLGSRNATNEDFEQVMTAIREGRLPMEVFGAHRTTLRELPNVLPTWAEPGAGVVKALVDVA